jgi:putative salt-induced outer membrane protein YdiY
MPRRRLREPQRGLRLLAVLVAVAMQAPVLAAEMVVLNLKSGDRVAGVILSETTNTIVLSNAWSAALSVPVAAIEHRGVQPSEAEATLAAGTNAPVATTGSTEASAPATAAMIDGGSVGKPKTPRRWQGKVDFGLDTTFGTSEAQNFFGGASLTYSVPYQQSPQRFFRTIANASGSYGRANGVISADQVLGSLKADFDLGANFYAYNLGGAGYDTVRKIDLQWELGPGLGWHAFKQERFVLDFETGGQYLARDLSVGEDTHSVFLRFGENLTWQIAPRITLKQNFAYLPQSTEFSDYRLRFDSTVEFGILQNLSLNLSVVNLYDSNPAQAVEPNQLQIRSTLGVNF